MSDNAVARSAGKGASVAPETGSATPLAQRGPRPGEVTVCFRRWTSYGGTAFQKGQFAGFPLHIAEELNARGACDLDPAYRSGAGSRMVRK